LVTILINGFGRIPSVGTLAPNGVNLIRMFGWRTESRSSCLACGTFVCPAV